MKNLSVAQIVNQTEAEGPGKRFAIWLQGCPMRCPGCCNPEMLPVVGGTAISVNELWNKIEKEIPQIEGISLLGGEPFAQAAILAELCIRVNQAGLSTMIFSGYTLAELKKLNEPGVIELLSLCDLLVDGRYERDNPELKRRWIGSSNQEMHFLTSRYSITDVQMMESNTVELRLNGLEVIVNGFPVDGILFAKNSRKFLKKV